MKQHGSSAPGMVLMILIMGSLTLNASRTLLDRGRGLVADEQQHYKDFWAAQSALRWGMTLNWPVVRERVCQQHTPLHWRSCLQDTDNGRMLLKGERTGSELALWHWVERQENRIRALPHGWIDYCPLAAPERCL